MKNLNTPQAILCGFALIALAVASIPYSSSIVTPAHAVNNTIHKIAICDASGEQCASILGRFGVDHLYLGVKSP
jgi:hypothetical protein